MSEEDLRKKRFYGIEKPKTYNKTFGSLQDFLSFFGNRGPEIKKFVTILQEAETSQDIEKLNKDVLPLIVNAMKEESTKVPDKTGEEKIIALFQVIFTSFREFYGAILKAYTIEGFLYRNMNLYLRTEDWTQLHCLLPYTYCLCRVFLQSELASTDSQSPNDERNRDKLILYRGMRLDEASLSLYKHQLASNFSWISVTSTSTNRKMAAMFMNNSKADDKKVPVMFIIEVPLSIDNLQSPNWIDAKPFSDYPTEDEIILCPGSPFQLIDVYRDKKKAEVRLRLISDVGKLAHQGQIMHGAMHAEMIVGAACKIVFLHKNELAEAISHLKGNQLIEELEFNLCKFDKNNLIKLIDTIPTLPRLSKFTCSSASSEDKKHLDVMLKLLSQKEIKSLEIMDQLLEDEQYMISFAKGVQRLPSLRTLTLDFGGCEHIADERVKNLCSNGFKHLTSLTVLTLNFAWCENITDEGVKGLCCDGLKHLTSLTALNLNFERCRKITAIGVKSLCCDGLKFLTPLTALTLNFRECSGITDEEVKSLCFDGLKHLTLLRALNLNFDDCLQITDEGVKSLCSDGLAHLTSLIALTLNFRWGKITNEGMKKLCSDGLRHLPSLTALDLNFDQCWHITDIGIKSLSLDRLKHLTSLTALALNFQWGNITNEGVKKLSDGLKHLTSLTALTLNFEKCEEITNKGEEAIKS